MGLDVDHRDNMWKPLAPSRNHNLGEHYCVLLVLVAFPFRALPEPWAHWLHVFETGLAGVL